MQDEPRSNDLVVYGAYGYTGELIVRQCLRAGLRPLLSGRSAGALAEVAARHDLPFQACPLDDPAQLDRLVSGMRVVVHAAGPFIHTAKPMVEACLRKGVHYLDITGEIEVFRMVHGYDRPARERGIMLLPGVGFDVVPSDCLAAHLKERMPDADQLVLAFASSGGPSRGTKLTAVEGLGRGGAIRENGRLKAVPDAFDTRMIPFADHPRLAVTIPWGDVYTAYCSTGIANIRVYMATSPKMIRMLRWGRWMQGLLRSQTVKEFLRSQVRSGRPGPTEQQLANGQVEFWGSVQNPDGKIVASTLRTPNGYTLTALSAVHIAQRVLLGEVEPGFRTPSMAYGSELITRCTGQHFQDQDAE